MPDDSLSITPGNGESAQGQAITSQGHRWGRVAVIAVTFVLYVALLFSPLYIGTNFANPDKRGENSTFVDNDIKPARWTFGLVWGTIFVAQLLWLVYSLTTLFRKSQGGYLYYSPDYMPLSFYLGFCAMCVTQLVWTAVFNEDTSGGRIAGCVILYTLAYESYAVIFISLWALNKHGPELLQQGKLRDYRLVQVLVQNGLGLYAAWLSLAAMLNLTIVLNNDTSLEMDAGSIITLFCILFDVTAWVMLDNFVLYKFTYHLLSPYAVLSVALIGSVSRNYVAGNTSSILLVMLLIVVLCATVLKVVLFFVRGKGKDADSKDKCKNEYSEIMDNRY